MCLGILRSEFGILEVAKVRRKTVGGRVGAKAEGLHRNYYMKWQGDLGARSEFLMTPVDRGGEVNCRCRRSTNSMKGLIDFDRP